MTIWKFPLKVFDVQDVAMPIDRTILSVGNDPNGEMCLWAEVNPKADTEHVKIRIVGTGNSCNDVRHSKFIGTVVRGPFVWHVYHD